MRWAHFKQSLDELSTHEMGAFEAELARGEHA